MNKDNQGILLESGTNELEILEFTVANNKFGINVIKVREIINPMEVTVVPHSHDHVEGIIQYRGDVLTVVNMSRVLGLPETTSPDQDKFIVSEFNQMKIVFRVNSVSQIHRISWQQIEQPSDLYQGLENNVIGVVKFDEKMILLLDFEKIVGDIHPESSIDKNEVKQLGDRERSDKTILLAEDSAMLRKMLEETLHDAGYMNLKMFEDGADAIKYLEETADQTDDIVNEVQLVITDIEMPQMDGHHLTKRIKDHDKLQKLPVIIFSSLITEDLLHKGEKVGANAQVSKPEIGKLVQLIDEHVL